MLLGFLLAGMGLGAIAAGTWIAAGGSLLGALALYALVGSGGVLLTAVASVFLSGRMAGEASSPEAIHAAE
jgi:hypothetical protein